MTILALGGEFLVNTQTVSNQYLPTVTGLSNGGFVVTWTDSSRTLGDASSTSIKAQLYDVSGSKVGGEFLVNTQTTDTQAESAVTGLPNGGFAITWTDYGSTVGDTSAPGVKAQIFDASGAPVGSEFLVNTETNSYQFAPKISALADGRIVISWTDYSGAGGDSSPSSVKAQIFDGTGGKIGSEFLVNTQTLNQQSDQSITGLAGGGFVVTWTDYNGPSDGSGYSVKAQVYDATGARVGSEFLVNTTTYGNQYVPSIAALADGGFVVTWSGTIDDPVLGSSGVTGQMFDATGAKVGSEFQVNTETRDLQYNAVVTGLDTGGFVVSWEDNSHTLGDTSETSIKAQVFDSHGAKVGTEVLVNTETSGGQRWTSIAGFENGRFVVVWADPSGTRGDATGYSIKAQIYSTDHAPLIVSDGGGDSAAVTVDENSVLATRVETTDADAGDTLTYAITGGADAALFDIDAATGELTFKTAPDFENPNDGGSDNTYDVVVTVSDGTLSDTQAIAVTVADANEEPAITSNGGGATAAFVIDELAPFVTQVDASDPDTGTTLVYSINGGVDAALFAIDAATGQLTFITPRNVQTPGDANGDNIYDVVVKASDGTLSATQALSVEVWRTLTGTTDDDTITGTPGGDHIFGLAGDDIIDGSAGNDVIDGGEGADIMSGGGGNDTYIVDNASDKVIELYGQGFDTVQSSVSYALSGAMYPAGTFVEALVLTGNAAINGIGNGLNNTLTGNSANNTLDGGWGMDRMVGGLGDDTYIVDNIGDTVIELSGQGNDTVRASVSYSIGATDVETLVLTGGAAINGTGNALDNALFGNVGANTLDGGAGADTMAGGQGDDIYIVDNVNDKVIELLGQGYDTVRSSVSYALSGAMYSVGTFIEALVLTGNAAINGTGNALANSLTGNSAANTLDGSLGADTMAGGQGDDTYIVDNAGDTVIELSGQGNDTVRSSVSYAIVGTAVETLVLTGGAAINGTGNGLDNTLIGNSGSNTLDGGAGADTMTGGLGDDTYIVANVSDKVIETPGQGYDTVRSSVSYALSGAMYPAGTFVEALVLTGNAAINGTGNGLANSLTGNSAANQLNGLTGDDMLSGGLGNDTLFGGAGADKFLFDSAPNGITNVDRVRDFSHSEGDQVLLSKAIFTGLGALGELGAGAFLASATASAAQGADERLVYNTTTGQLWYDADGVGGLASVQIAAFGTSSHPALVYSDFQIVG